MTSTPSQWSVMIERNPAHSHNYADRFRQMEAAGQDLGGEARMIDTMLPRRSRILDAGCGPGRVGYLLHQAGHTVVGVDVDPTLVEIASAEKPGPVWVQGDLAELDLPARGIAEPFDAIVCAGNVMGFLHPATRGEVLRRFAAHLAPDGRAAIGFGAGRGYDFGDFLADAHDAGLKESLLLSTWDLRPFTPDSTFLVAILERA